MRFLSAAAGIFLSSASLFAQHPPPAAPPDTFTLVRCGHLMAVPGTPVQDNVTLVLKNSKIESILPGLDVKPKLAGDGLVTEIDLRDQWVLPGLIDCHVHLTMQFDRTLRTRYVSESPAFIALRAATYARITLEAGFTTVRDLGANEPQTILALRDAINEGLVMGPRILAAGHAITMTGGHADQSNGFRNDLLVQPDAGDGIADGKDECAKAVRAQIKLGADVIKVTATGGVLSASTAGLAQHYTDDELTTIVKTAHSLGRKVAAHAHGTDGINSAIRAGVDSIEHGTYLDDVSIGLFKERGLAASQGKGAVCYHVPTLLAAQTVFDNAHQPGFYLPMVAKKALEVGPKAKDMLRRSHESGVTIAFGTDSGVSPHGQNAREFKLLVDAGMTAQEAIFAATGAAAHLLGVEKEVGSLQPGKAADLIAVKGDPLSDITQLEHVTFVMRGGVVVKR